MNIAQLSERLKDVPQIKLIEYAQNPSGVVPQYLALAEIQRRKSLQQAPAEMASSTVADDIMTDARSDKGIPTLPMPGMFEEQRMAAGGIVAFADGGEAEEEYEEALEKSRRSRLQGIQEALADASAYVMNPLAKAEAKPTRAQRMMAQEMPAQAPVERKGSHKYEDIVIAEAQRQGIDPALARHILYKETGNVTNPETIRSKAGAIGVMQLMPATAKELGVNPMNPEENIRGGITYLRKMMDKYNDPVLAAAAYNAGPGRVDKAIKGQGLTALPRETRMYIAGLAEGGEVKGYYDGGELDYYPGAGMGFGYAEPSTFAEKMALDELRRQELLKKRLGTQQPATPVPTQTNQTETQPAFTYPPQVGIGPTYGEMQYVEPAKPKSASESYFEALMDDIKQRAEGMKAAREENRNLALLQAGLGMMASTSPYALTGIGQGAMQGASAYAAGKKGLKEEERSLTAARLGAAKAKATQEEAEATREALGEYRKGVLGRQLDESKVKELALFRDDLRQYEQMRIKQIENKYKNNPLFGTDPTLQARFNSEVASIQNEPQYMAMLKRAYPGLELPKTTPTSGGEKKKPLSSFGS